MGNVYLRFVAAELSVAISQSLQTNGELDVTASDDVLNLKLGELRVKAELLNDPRVFTRREARIIFRLGTSNDHLARRENEGGRLGVANTHDDGCKTLYTCEQITTVRHVVC